MDTITVEDAGGVRTITLNRPDKKNAINGVMWDELLAAFADAGGDDSVRVLVITGAGGAFCSGADISDGVSASSAGLASMRHVGDVCLALHRVPKPTIAKVGGVAAGAGLNLALGCDLVVASDDARFSEIFHRRGLSIDFGGSWVLPRLIGLHKAKELAFFADVITAKEAADFGIVNRIVPAAELDAFVDEWATRLAAGPPIALSLTKTLLNNSMAVSMSQAVEDESRAQTVNFNTTDLVEAVSAFVQKREPKFEGR